jgi:uncharacterized protein (TIGR02466 family)
MEAKFLNRFDYFPTPVWRFEMPEFEKHHKELAKYVARDEHYFVEREMNGMHITEGNLHDKELHPELSIVTDFFTSCFENVMDQMGYEKEIGITSMWATRHKQGGNHHEHVHHNTFLAGVLYLFDMDGNANGTAFKNHNGNLYQIVPRLKKGARQFLTTQEQVPFVAGTAIIFPSWANHVALPSPSKYRMIIGANCMPVGRTNSDHYHQYVFPKPEDFGYLTLEEDIKAGYIKG